MNVIQLVQPTVEPVTLLQVWEHLRLTPTVDIESPKTFEPYHPDDSMLQRHMVAARMDCENRTRRSFVYQKRRLITGSRDRDYWPWPYGWGRFCRGIEIPRPPLQSVEAISYYDGANALQVVDPANYYISEDEPARLEFASGYSLAGTTYDRSDALRVDYWAGYTPLGSPADDFTTEIPEAIKAAILIGVELFYDPMTPEQRRALERTQENLLAPYVVQIAI